MRIHLFTSNRSAYSASCPFFLSFSSQSAARLVMLMAAIFLSTAGSAWCSALASMVDQMRSGQATLAVINAEKDSLTASNERDLKEHTAYNESFLQLEAKKTALKVNFWKEANERLASANSIVAGYNGKCGGELDEPVLKSCEAERTKLEPVVLSIRESVTRDANSFNKGQIAPIDEILNGQKKAMDELSIRMKGRFEKWLKGQEKANELTAKLENIRSALVEACSSATTAESIKYCSSIGWDGAKQDLPPLQEIRPTFSVTPN